MRNQEFYRKYKASYPSLVDPIFSRKNWWRLLLIVVLAVLIEPLIVYGRQQMVPFSWQHYLQLLRYLLIIAVPIVMILVWLNIRELIKRQRGYGWVGKFEVVGKQWSLAFCYVVLSPGEDHRLKIDRGLFEKISIGDLIQVRRDALGRIQEVSKVDTFTYKLAYVAKRRGLSRNSRKPEGDINETKYQADHGEGSF